MQDAALSSRWLLRMPTISAGDGARVAGATLERPARSRVGVDEHRGRDVEAEDGLVDDDRLDQDLAVPRGQVLRILRVG